MGVLGIHPSSPKECSPGLNDAIDGGQSRSWVAPTREECPPSRALRALLALADILVPHLRIPLNEGIQQAFAFRRTHIDDFDTVLTQPVNAPTKRTRLSHDHFHDAELSDETAAVPTRRER